MQLRTNLSREVILCHSSARAQLSKKEDMRQNFYSFDLECREKGSGTGSAGREICCGIWTHCRPWKVDYIVDMGPIFKQRDPNI